MVQASKACNTRSGVNGISRSRIPTASNTAFALAAAVGPCEAYPLPRVDLSTRLIRITSISGASGNLNIG